MTWEAINLGISTKIPCPGILIAEIVVSGKKIPFELADDAPPKNRPTFDMICGCGPTEDCHSNTTNMRTETATDAIIYWTKSTNRAKQAAIELEWNGTFNLIVCRAA